MRVKGVRTVVVDLADSPDIVAVVTTDGESSLALHRTIDAVSRQQTDRKIGILVVAATSEVIVECPPHVTIVHVGMPLHEAGQLGVARAQVTTGFMWFLPGGTAPASNVLDALFGALANDESLGMVRAVPRDSRGRIPVGKLGGVIREHFASTMRDSTSDLDLELLPASPVATVTGHVAESLAFIRSSGALIRLSAWDAVGGMDARLSTSLWADAVFCRALAIAGYRFLHLTTVFMSVDDAEAEAPSDRSFARFLEARDAATARDIWFGTRDGAPVPPSEASAERREIPLRILSDVAATSARDLRILGELIDEVVTVVPVEDSDTGEVSALIAAGFQSQYSGQQAGALRGLLRFCNRTYRKMRFTLDPVFYRRAYPDLRMLSRDEATDHWKTSGAREGRFPNRRAVDAQARVHRFTLSRVDIAEYVLANPQLGHYGVTTYEGAYVLMAGDVAWLRNPSVVSLPTEFLDSLDESAQLDLADSWAYDRDAPSVTIDSPLAHRLESVPADVFVLAVFKFFVGHSPTASGFQLWVARLDSGEYSRASVITALVAAGPFALTDYTASTTAEDVARASYELSLHRHVTRTPPEYVELMGIRVVPRVDWYRTALESLAAVSEDASLQLPREPRPKQAKRKPSAGSRPRASILVSLYRSDNHLDAWVRNVESLDDLDRLEIIVVAVDPSDREKSVLERFARDNHNVKLEYREHPFGIYAAWNLGLELATADYVTNMNVDDVRAPHSVIAQADLLDRYDWVDVVYQDVQMSLQAGMPWEHLAAINATCQVPVTSIPLLVSGQNPPHNGPMWRRRLHDELGVFDETYLSAADFDFWIRCARAGKTFFNVPAAHVGYFHNPEGMSTSHEGIGMREGRLILAKNQHELLMGEAPSYVARTDEFGELRPRTDRLTAGFVSALVAARTR